MSAASRPASPQAWSQGDPILLRELHDGRIWVARPARVAAVQDGLVAIYLAPGTTWMVPASTERAEVLHRLKHGWELTAYERTRARVLYLFAPEVSQPIHLWWIPPDWRFGGWYINLQEPIRPTPLGFDYMDRMLDVVIAPDLSWHWKDEDELEEAVALDMVTPRQAAEIRAEGERVIDRLEARTSPFCDGWERWRPDPAWPIPELPAGWDELGV